jgi:glutathione S-transferase
MASKFLLVSFETCPWVQRAAIVLRQKGIDYDIEYIDRDNRPDWFLAISPHSKVPVLRVDDEHSIFESNAIAEYLDEVVAPRLAPEDPIARACNRAWTDYIATFSGAVSTAGYATDEEDLKRRVEKIPAHFAKLEDALGKRGNDGPFFNGEAFSLVDAAYAPALQRYSFLDRLYPLGIIENYPRLAAWRDALLASESVKTSTLPNFEQIWRENLIRRDRWTARFIESAAAAE